MGEEKKVVRSMLFKSNAYIKSIMTANIALCLYWLSWRRKCVLFFFKKKTFSAFALFKRKRDIVFPILKVF